MISRLSTIAVVGGIVTAGALAGFLGQRAWSDDVRTVTATAPRGEVTTFVCPGGTIAGTLHGGDRIYIVGRGGGADSDWLQIRNPGDANERWWIEASTIDADASTATLPVEACAPGDDIPSPTTTVAREAEGRPTTTKPDESTTSSSSTTSAPDSPTTQRPTQTSRPGVNPGPQPPTRPTTPGTSPATNPPATLPKPVVQKPVSQYGTLFERYDGGYACGGKPTSTISVGASNASTATLYWRVAGKDGSKAMSRSGSTFSATLGPFGTDTLAYGTHADIDVWVVAHGPGGSTTSPHTSVRLDDCTFG